MTVHRHALPADLVGAILLAATVFAGCTSATESSATAQLARQVMADASGKGTDMIRELTSSLNWQQKETAALIERF